MEGVSLGRGRGNFRKLSALSQPASSGVPKPPGTPAEPRIPRAIIGRGFSDAQGVNQIAENLSSLDTSNNTQESPKKILERDLDNILKDTNRCFIRATINFFNNDNDVQFYVEKVIKCALDSFLIGKKFAMSLNYITSHKLYGPKIKGVFMSKLHSHYETMSALMKDSTGLSAETKTRLLNFCSFLGQVYFRFRPTLELNLRYEVFSDPVISCMTYLLNSGGVPELSLLVQQLFMNYKALHDQQKEKVLRLYDDARGNLVKRDLTEKGRLWLLCVIELFNHRCKDLHEDVADFYASQAGKKEWSELLLEKNKGKIILLHSLPVDLNPNEEQQFGMGRDFYLEKMYLDQL